MVPYDGDVTITCAPATTPSLDLETPTTPAPTAGDRGGITVDDDDATRSPVPEVSQSNAPAVNAPNAPAVNAPAVASAQESEGEGDSNTAVIAGSVAGGVALLAIAGLVAYKLKKASPPPPSYDDLVGA